MFPRRRGSHWHPSIPRYKSVSWPDSAGNLSAVRREDARGKMLDCEKEESLCPCSYEAQCITWFHKIYKMRCKPRSVPHAQKKNMLKQGKRFILVLGKKLNDTSSSMQPMTLMTLGICWRRHFIQVCLLKSHLGKLHIARTSTNNWKCICQVYLTQF